MTKLQDITKLCFLPGSLLPLKDGKYPYINLLKLGLANLGVTYPTPAPSAPSLTATQIAFGDGSNLMTSSNQLLFNSSNGDFTVSGILEGSYLDDIYRFGDLALHGTGGKIIIDNPAGLAYYDNTAHTGFFGINTSTPTVALDVVGAINVVSDVQDNIIIGTGNGYFGDRNNGTYIMTEPTSGNNKILLVSGNGNVVFNGGDGSFAIDNLSGTGTRAVLADSSGVLSAPVSDISTKTNIKPIENGLSKLMQLKPVSFEFIEEFNNFGIGEQIGFIAQDVQKVLPNSVFLNESGKTKGKLGINKEDIIPILTAALQEQQKLIEKLQNQIEILNEKSKI